MPIYRKRTTGNAGFTSRTQQNEGRALGNAGKRHYGGRVNQGRGSPAGGDILFGPVYVQAWIEDEVYEAKNKTRYLKCWFVSPLSGNKVTMNLFANQVNQVSYVCGDRVSERELSRYITHGEDGSEQVELYRLIEKHNLSNLTIRVMLVNRDGQKRWVACKTSVNGQGEERQRSRSRGFGRRQHSSGHNQDYDRTYGDNDDVEETEAHDMDNHNNTQSSKPNEA